MTTLTGKTKQPSHPCLLSLGARLRIYFRLIFTSFPTQTQLSLAIPMMLSNGTANCGATIINKTISCWAEAPTQLLNVGYSNTCYWPPKHRPVGFANGKKGRECCFSAKRQTSGGRFCTMKCCVSNFPNNLQVLGLSSIAGLGSFLPAHLNGG